MSPELKIFNEWVRPLLFITGIQVIASNEIRPGDYVKIQSGEEGYVSDIIWRYTTIRSLPNNRIIVPNAKLSSQGPTPEDARLPARREGRPYPWSQQAIHEISGLGLL
jgi:hypothetical protein